MPTQVCVPIMVEEVDAALRDAALAKDLGADLVEFRVDRLLSGLGPAPEDPETGFRVGQARRLAAESPLPCIVTCRPAWEGGAYEGSDAVRLDALRAVATGEYPPRYVDVELEVFRREPMPAMQLAAAAGEGASRLIVSIHDFETRPDDLQRRLLRAREIAAASVIKIAHRARSLRDNEDLFRVLEEADRPAIALGMGEFGLMSRVLAGKFGALLTFAGLREAAATAPGQPTLADLLGTYRFRSIGRDTRVYGVIGWPLGHSLSPALHNAVFEAVGHDGVYLPLPVAASEDQEATYGSLKATLAQLVHDPRLDFSGASVTIPHKAALLRLAAESGWEIEPAAGAIGAANTLVVERGPDGRVTHARVCNTDAPAALRVLEELLDEEVRGRRVTVLGAGGAARGVAYAAMAEGAHVTIAARDRSRAEALARELAAAEPPFVSPGRAAAVALDDAAEIAADAVVNCTPIGMAGGPDPDGVPIDVRRLAESGPGVVVFDTVYNPPEPPLVRAAAAAGLRAVGGVGMFVRQAALQAKAWTKRDPPLALIERVVRERLGASD